jgi:hypothetical protein
VNESDGLSGSPGALPFRLIYSENYDLNLGDHVFPSKKYRWLHDRLIRSHFAAPEDFVEPSPATDEDLRLVHDTDWVDKLRSGTLTYHDILRLEIPYSREMVAAFCLAAGGTILAARLAMEAGVGFKAWDSTSAADSTMRFPGMARGFARSTISRCRSGGCSVTDSFAAPWWWIATCTMATAPRLFSPVTSRCSRFPFTS